MRWATYNCLMNKLLVSADDQSCPLFGNRRLSRHGGMIESQREDRHDRALRRGRKLCHRLGADPADGWRVARQAETDAVDDLQPVDRRACGGGSSGGRDLAGHVIGACHPKEQNVSCSLNVSRFGPVAKRLNNEHGSPRCPRSYAVMCLTTAMLNCVGSSAPCLASSSVVFATSNTAGSLRSIKPRELRAASNAFVMDARSSGLKAPLSSASNDWMGMTSPMHYSASLSRWREPVCSALNLGQFTESN